MSKLRTLSRGFSRIAFCAIFLKLDDVCRFQFFREPSMGELQDANLVLDNFRIVIWFRPVWEGKKSPDIVGAGDYLCTVSREPLGMPDEARLLFLRDHALLQVAERKGSQAIVDVIAFNGLGVLHHSIGGALANGFLAEARAFGPASMIDLPSVKTRSGTRYPGSVLSPGRATQIKGSQVQHRGVHPTSRGKSPR
ncbi:hypothetical protein K8Q93_03565 [Candidatus Parcubacteria bacterium]|nr:hypothetical protein [Candidatus Parcubacteria bacterium]